MSTFKCTLYIVCREWVNEVGFFLSFLKIPVWLVCYAHVFHVRVYVCCLFSAHFHHLLNEGVPMPIQTGAQVPFLIITYAAIGTVMHRR